jgi:acyl-CoA thioesterase YciA
MPVEYLALQVLMMPRDANPLPPLPGSSPYAPQLTIFGGILLSHIDQAGAIGARREVVRAGGEPPALVTVAVNRVEFLKPVYVGDVVRFLTRLVKMGRTSITMHVQVEVERGREVISVTEAEVVYVGVDLTTPERKPKPLLGEQGT